MMSTGDMSGKVVTEQDYEDLRKKLHLLEGDRKAYYEMSMQTMKANKALVAQLREENKELRMSLAEIQKKRSRMVGVNPNAEELQETLQELERMKRHYDMCRENTSKKTKQLNLLKDQARDLELESQKPNEGDSPFSRKIRMLENRLDKAMIKYNEAQSIRKTYEQIVKRLREERVGFDNQLSAIERTLSSKQHDYEELLLLSGDANHAKEVALQELERVEKAYVEAKHQRDRDLKEKKELVQANTDKIARMESREKMRQDIIAKAAGDLDADDEQALKKKLAVDKMQHTQIEEDARKHRKDIDKYENAFRKIKDATGVSDVNLVIQKILSQEDNRENLMQLTKDNQGKIDAAMEEKARLKQKLEEIKYSGTTQGSHRRKLVDAQEEHLTLSGTKLERQRTQFERVAKILIDITAGVEHLKDKLEPLRGDDKHITTTQDTLVDVLAQCMRTLTSTREKINEYRKSNEDKRGNEDDISGLVGDASLRQSVLTEAKTTTMTDEAVMAARPYNRRIQLHIDDDQREDGMDDPDFDDIDVKDILNRDTIKKASDHIVDSKTKKSKKTKGKRSKRGSSSRTRGRMA